jgi:hypothetical protein
MEEPNTKNTGPSQAAVLLFRIFVLDLIILGIFLVQVSRLASEGSEEESRPLMII